MSTLGRCPLFLRWSCLFRKQYIRNYLTDLDAVKTEWFRIWQAIRLWNMNVVAKGLVCVIMAQSWPIIQNTLADQLKMTKFSVLGDLTKICFSPFWVILDELFWHQISDFYYGNYGKRMFQIGCGGKFMKIEVVQPVWRNRGSCTSGHVTLSILHHSLHVVLNLQIFTPQGCTEK